MHTLRPRKVLMMNTRCNSNTLMRFCPLRFMQIATHVFLSRTRRDRKPLTCYRASTVCIRSVEAQHHVFSHSLSVKCSYNRCGRPKIFVGPSACNTLAIVMLSHISTCLSSRSWCYITSLLLCSVSRPFRLLRSVARIRHCVQFQSVRCNAHFSNASIFEQTLSNITRNRRHRGSTHPCAACCAATD